MIALITHLVVEKRELGRYLVVVPASVLTHWQDEIARFSPQLEVAAYRGTFDERSAVWSARVRRRRLHTGRKKLHRCCAAQRNDPVAAAQCSFLQSCVF